MRGRRLDRAMLARVSGGGLSTAPPPLRQIFDDGSSLTTASDGRTHAVPAFDSLYRQGTLGDCYAIAPLNSIASTPAGRSYLDSIVREVGPNAYEVDLRNRSGQPTTVQVHDPNGGAATIEGRYAAIEKALGVQSDGFDDPYRVIGNGGDSRDVMRRLGLDNVAGRSDLGFEGTTPANGMASVVATNPGVNQYGLVGNHEYSVVGRGHDDVNGRDVVYLANPHGSEPTLSVPESEVATLFNTRYAASGEVPTTRSFDPAPAPGAATWSEPNFGGPQTEPSLDAPTTYNDTSTYNEPSYVEPTYNNTQTYNEPSYVEPTYNNTQTYNEPSYVEPTYNNTSTYNEPSYTEPTYNDTSTYNEPSYSEPVATANETSNEVSSDVV